MNAARKLDSLYWPPLTQIGAALAARTCLAWHVAGILQVNVNLRVRRLQGHPQVKMDAPWIESCHVSFRVRRACVLAHRVLECECLIHGR